jgi:HD-GYP domain-containing protein (c-di-GMP phosphodiesterase class II)
MKRHPSIGERIIRQVNRLGYDVARGAMEHHEKLDSSGYPSGLRDISLTGQIIGVIDCYEALTNEDRPYRRAADPLDTLELIKRDVEIGKFNRDIFEKFCYSPLIRAVHTPGVAAAAIRKPSGHECLPCLASAAFRRRSARRCFYADARA